MSDQGLVIAKLGPHGSINPGAPMATRTREELQAELDELTERLERLEARKSNDRADDQQNLEESSQWHEDDEVVDGLAQRTRDRIAEIQATLGANTRS
jgi:flagellar motility protein MotE (MotC chaperone)